MQITLNCKEYQNKSEDEANMLSMWSLRLRRTNEMYDGAEVKVSVIIRFKLEIFLFLFHSLFSILFVTKFVQRDLFLHLEMGVIRGDVTWGLWRGFNIECFSVSCLIKDEDIYLSSDLNQIHHQMSTRFWTIYPNPILKPPNPHFETPSTPSSTRNGYTNPTPKFLSPLNIIPITFRLFPTLLISKTATA